MEKKIDRNEGRNNEERKDNSKKRKALFLTSYEEWGTVKTACTLSKVPKNTYKYWIVQDDQFAKDFHEAKVGFGETLEAIALDRVRNPDKGKGSDLLLLGLLNANMPQKYRPNMAMNEDSARDVIAELRKISREKQTNGPAEEQVGELTDPMKEELANILEKRK
jgi:hypothetical protein